MEVVLSGVIGAVVGAGIGAFVSIRAQDRNDQADRRRHAVVILGEIRALIDDFSPDQWALNARRPEQAEPGYPSSSEMYQTLSSKWRQLRPQALSLRALYPDFADEVEDLYRGTGNLMYEVATLVATVLEPRSGGDMIEWRDRARESQGKVRELVNRLMDHVGNA